MATASTAGKIGELYVFNELLKRGAAVYVPLVDEGVDALVQTSAGGVVELQIKVAGGAGGKDPGWFQVPKVGPRENWFVIAVEAPEQKPGNVWVFPSSVFDKYAGRPPKGSPRDLNLDSGVKKYGMPLRDILCGFRNRWELIVDFEKFEHLLGSPEDLEDILAMREALESPEGEAITLEDYEHPQSSAVPD